MTWRFSPDPLSVEDQAILVGVALGLVTGVILTALAVWGWRR